MSNTNKLTMKATIFGVLTVGLGFTVSAPAQVTTDVPPAVTDAKPVTVERIKVHGTALEGNLEGDAVDRDVIIFLPPSYATRRAGVTR